MEQACEEAQQERSAEDKVSIRRIDEARYDSGVENAIKKRRYGEEESDQRAGGSHVEESASCANGRPDQNESSKSTDERGEGYEKGVCGINVVAATGKEMAQLMGEPDGHKSCGKRQADE